MIRGFPVFSIREKIFVSFFLIVFICASMILIGYWRLNQAKGLINTIVPYSQQMSLFQEFAISLGSLERNVDKFSLARYGEYQAAAEEDVKTMSSLLDSLKKNSIKESITKLGELGELTRELRTGIHFLLSLQDSSVESRLVNEKILLVYKNIERAKLIHRELALENTGLINANVKNQKEIILLIVNKFLIFGISILLFGLLASLFISRAISRPLIKLKTATKEIAKGNLNLKIDIVSHDELGDLADSFNKMTEDLQKITVSRDELAKEAEERKRVEEQLRESELYSRTILDAVKAGFILIDADSHKIVEVNAVAINMFGMSKENIIGSVCHQFICPAEVGKCPITDLGQTVDNSERVLLNAKGGRVPVIKTVAPVIFGSRRYLLESFIDITERKSMEEELRKRMQDLEEAKAKLEERTKDLSHAQEATLNMMEDLEEAKVYIENILVNFLDSLMVVSIDGTIQKVNQVTLNLLGYKQEELLGQRVGIIADEGVLLNMVLEKGELRDYEINYRRKDGRLIPMLFSGSIMRDKDGGLIGLVEAAKDITERKKADEILQNYTKEIEGINKELDDFTYIISHDLKEPLRSIDAFSKFIEDDYRERLDEEGRGYLERIRANSLRMQNLIEDLLEISRIGRRRNPLEEAETRDLLNEVKLRLEYSIKEKNVQIVIRDGLPKIFCDRVRVVEAFVNLFSNAIKFNDKASPKIEVGCNIKDDHYEFYVRDNGPGVEEQYREKIFEIFQRLGKREDTEGTGAGLTIVRKIIEMHKGKIWVDSKVGEFTTFYFTIPKKKEAILGKKKLGEILVEKKLVTEEELKKALDEQEGRG